MVLYSEREYVISMVLPTTLKSAFVMFCEKHRDGSRTNNMPNIFLIFRPLRQS